MRNKNILKKEISRLVKKVKEVKNFKGHVYLGNLTKIDIEKISKILNIKDIESYKRVIYADETKHIINVHGSEKEYLRGQIPIEEKDFLLIPEILNTKNIIYNGKSKKGLDVLLYCMELNNIYFLAEEARTGKKELIVLSLYKKKK